MNRFITNSAEETEQLGERIASKLKGMEVIALFGGLGMGKTAFTRGLARGLGADDVVSSPTFALVNEYSGRVPVYHFDMYRVTSWDDLYGRVPVYHFDMYRVTSWDDLYSTGFFDYLDTGVLIIEWSENIEGALPENALRITISRGENDNQRIFDIEGVTLEDIGG